MTMTMTMIFDQEIINHRDHNDEKKCQENVVEKKMTVNDSDRWSSVKYKKCQENVVEKNDSK